MKEEKKKYEDDETTELDIEVLTEIQGGIEDEKKLPKEDCGLGCFVGSGLGKPDNSIN